MVLKLVYNTYRLYRLHKVSYVTLNTNYLITLLSYKKHQWGFILLINVKTYGSNIILFDSKL